MPLQIYVLTYKGRATKVFPHEMGLFSSQGLISARKDGIECVFSPEGDLTPGQKATLIDAGFGYVLYTPAGRRQ
jgi:hypothetical protein